MAEEIVIGLKKKGPAEGSAKTDKRPDIELTEEDLKQIAGGTTKAIQLRPSNQQPGSKISALPGRERLAYRWSTAEQGVRPPVIRIWLGFSRLGMSGRIN